MNYKTYFCYWGKAQQREDGTWNYHLLPYHCLDVAAVGGMISRHLFIVANMAEKCKVDRDDFINWLTFIISIHDIGKFSNGFQSRIPELCNLLHESNINAGYREKHWSLGYQFLAQNNTNIFPNGNIDFMRYWYSASTGHHGRPPSITQNPQPMQFQFPRNVQADAMSFIAELKEMFSIHELPFNADVDYYKILPRISWLVAGITMLADWLGSNEEWFLFFNKEMRLKAYFTDTALNQAEIAVKKSGVLPLSVSPVKSISVLFPSIANFTNFQKTAEQIDIDKSQQLFILEEETGKGKTEAALTLAHRIMSKGLADGIYFALPTMATANAMYKRVKNMYKEFYKDYSNPSFILAHSANKMYLSLEKLLSDKKDEAYEDNINQDFPFWISDNRKKALLAHIGIGTIDQALLAVLQAKHQALRLLGLSRKVLIVDEVHACDDYVHTLLKNLLKFHASYGASAILLSATLPINMRKELIESYAEGIGLPFNQNLKKEYPLISKYSASGFQEIAVGRSGHKRTVEIQAINNYENVFLELRKALNNGRCACWVRNTVYDAMAAYHEAQKQFGEENVILFHARFALGNRLDIESNIISLFDQESTGSRRKRKLVIATQVVEQSLDIDFDFMISDLAPIDLIIQRAGRLCRHNRSIDGNRIDGIDKRGTPVMAVYMPVIAGEPKTNWYKEVFPKGARVYQHIGRLWLTAKWLIEHGKFTMPDDARKMIEYVYEEEIKDIIPEVFEKMDYEAEGYAKAAASMANFNELNLEVGYMPDGMRWIDDDNAPTRLGEPMVSARLAFQEDGRLVPLIRKGQGADWELSQVSVYRRLIAYENEADRQLIDEAKSQMPDKGKYCLLIILKQYNNQWIGKVLNIEKQVITVYYDGKAGLQICKGEEDEFD